MYALQRHNTDNSKQKFPEKELRCFSPNFHIHEPVIDLYNSTRSVCLFFCRKLCGPILGIYVKIANSNRHMNVYINGIFVAVQTAQLGYTVFSMFLMR